MKRLVLYFVLLLALASIASAATTISISAGTGYGRSIEIRWNVTSDVNLTSLKLVRENDNKTVTFLPLSGNHMNDFTRDEDVDVVSTYTYTLMIWDETGAVTTASTTAKLDIDPPKIISPLSIQSTTNVLTLTLDEPGKCVAGLNNDSLAMMNGTASNNTLILAIPALKQGDNIIYVVCTDPYGNEFPKATAISFNLNTADTTKPTKPSLNVGSENGSVKFTWAASTDAGGIKEYRIYKSTDKNEVFSSTPQVTNDLYLIENPQQTTYYALGAVDNAGNEERSDVIEIIKQGTPAPATAPTPTPAAVPSPAPAPASENKGVFRMAYVAWAVFIIIIVWIIMHYQRKKKDKFGLDSYIHHRRKHYG